jgi:hypothetical protein
MVKMKRFLTRVWLWAIANYCWEHVVPLWDCPVCSQRIRERVERRAKFARGEICQTKRKITDPAKQMLLGVLFSVIVLAAGFWLMLAGRL